MLLGATIISRIYYCYFGLLDIVCLKYSGLKLRKKYLKPDLDNEKTNFNSWWCFFCIFKFGTVLVNYIFNYTLKNNGGRYCNRSYGNYSRDSNVYNNATFGINQGLLPILVITMEQNFSQELKRLYFKGIFAATFVVF